MEIAILTTDNRDHHRRYDVPAPYFGPAIEAVLDGLSRIPEVDVHVISCTQRPMAAPEKLAANTWFHLLDVPKIGWLRTGYQGCIRATRKLLRDLRPDIVHGQGTERDCSISAIFSGFPNVITIHGNMRGVARTLRPRIGTYLWCMAILERLSLPWTFGVFCNSRYTESMARRLTRRTWRVPNALRRAFFESSRAARSTTSKPILLNVGTISAHKRQLELLYLARNLHREGHAFEVHFIGSINRRDPYALRFDDEIKAAERIGFARFIGPQSLTDLIAAYDSASALVHVPSEEAFGLVVAEALSRNLKIFGTNVGGIPDICSGVDCIELHEHFDTLALGIAEWLSAGCPQPLAAAAEMRRRYHPDVIANTHVKIYQEVLETT